MNTTVAKAYLSTDVNTAEGSQLILRLYDKAVTCLSLGEEAMLEGNIEAKAQHLTRVLDIIHELTVSVNLDFQPVATNLFNLYSYMSQRVLNGCLRNDTAALHEVSTMLKDLRSAWEVAIEKHPAPAVPEEASISNSIPGPVEAGAA
jgi:flagellar protein FliS